MKKLLALVLGLAVTTAGVFAQDSQALEDAGKELATQTATMAIDATVEAAKAVNEVVDFPTGTWVDSNWNAEWVMDVAKVHLYDAAAGELVYTFTKQNTENFKFLPSEDGFTLSFTCPETHRSYKFTKALNLSSDLKMTINPDWTDSDYVVDIKFKSINIPDYVNK